MGRPQFYRVYSLINNYLGRTSSIKIAGKAGEIPDIYMSWVRDNQRVLAKFKDLEIISVEELINK